MADISVTLVLDDKGFVKSVNQAQNQVKQFGTTVDKEIGSTASKAFDSLKGAIASIGFTSMIAELASLAGETVKTAQSLGTSTAAVKAWQQSLGAAGGDIDNARDALIDLTQKMNEAITSGGDVQKAFQKIGLSLNDLQTMSNEDMMQAVIKGLANVADGAERSRLALILMGEDAKNVDWTKVARDYDSVAASAEKIAPSLESARQAQQAFNSTYNKFVDQLTVAIPWDSLTSGLQTIGNHAATIMETAKSVAILVAGISGLKALGPILELFGSFAAKATATVAAGAGFGAMLAGVSSSTRKFQEGLTIVGEAFGGLHRNMLPSFTNLERFGIILSTLGKGIVRFIPLVGQIAVAFTALNEATRLFSDNSLVEWADEGVGALAKFFDIEYQTFKEEEALHKRRKEVLDIATKQQEEEAAAVIAAEEEKQSKFERTSQLLLDTSKSVQQLVTSYQQQNAESLKAIQDQTSLIGLSTEAANKKRALIDLENEHIKKVQELNDKLAEPNLDPQQIAIYQKAIADVNAEYKNQVQAISSAMDAQNKKIEINRLEEFTNQSLISSMQRIIDINNETATMTLPLIEKKYYDIKAAADAAIASQLEAEAKARGITVEELPADYVAKVKEIGNARVQMEKDVADAQERVIRNRDLELFKIKELTSAQQEINDIKNELSNALLPEIARKEAEITQQAMARAEAAIKEEEARRGTSLNEQERQRYRDAAIASTKELIKVTKESYEQSRTWSYGWQKAWVEYSDNATNAAKVAGDFFNKTMTGMEDVLVNFAKTGKFEWKNFVASLIEDLLRAQIQAIFASTIGGMIGIPTAGGGSNQSSGLGGMLSGLFGGSSQPQRQQPQSSGGGFWSGVGNVLSGISSGVSNLFGGVGKLFSGFFATGGMIPPGRFGIVGENGPEYVSGPANVTPMTGATTVVYNINAVDARSFKEMIAADPSFLYAVTLQGAKSIPGRR